MKKYFSKSNIFMLLAIVLTVFVSDSAFAASLPWESGLDKLKNSLSGPVASGIALVGIIAAGGMLIFGGEISGFMKSIVYLVLVICLIIGANSLLSSGFFGTTTTTGATIAYIDNAIHSIA